MLHEFRLRFKALFHKRRMDRDMTEELAFHQALLREKLLREGVPQSEVDAATRRSFGSSAHWHERLSELWQFRWLEQLLRDVSFSLRMLKKSPMFTAIALITLVLGVGANTAIFSLINGLLLRPLAVPAPERLAVLRIDEGGPQPSYEFCTPFFRALEKTNGTFAQVFAYNGDMIQVQGASGSEQVDGMLVSGQFFQALQVPAARGRYLMPDDDRKGAAPVAVISERFWKRWFNQAPDVVGRKLVMANTAFTVVGVMPQRFIGADPLQRPDIYAPLSTDPIIDAPRNHIDDGIHAWWLTVVARMQPGVSLERANAFLTTVSNPILHATDDAGYIADEEKSHFHFSAESGSRGFTFARFLFRKPLTAMFAMCGGILLLACLNLASLLLARSASRERELATRLAMGATRRRLVQQLLVESLLLSIAGTAAGLAVAPLVSRSLSAIVMSGNGLMGASMHLDTALDTRVLLFGALIAVAAALLIGLFPALQATSGNLSDHIKEGQHATQAHERRRKVPSILLATEVALSLILVIGAGLLAASLIRLFQSGAGFNPKGLVNISFSMDKQSLEGDALMQLYQQLGDGLRHQPGVKNVSFQFIVPLSHRGWNDRYSAPGGKPNLIFMNSVAPDYFETMQIPMFSGREFRWSDTSTSGGKMILNQAAAKLLFPDGQSVGQQVVNDREKSTYEVVAVVGNAKYRNMRRPAPAAAYVPIMQDEEKKPSLSAVIRMEGPQAPLAAAARALTARLAPSIPAPVFTTMDEVIDESLNSERLMALLSVYFAVCALLVTAIGLYGTLAYATARRTSEIGIRMALGSGRARVVTLVFRENAIVALAGMAAGFAVALLAARALASLLYGTSTRDPWVLGGSLLALGFVASAASLIPAIRAARIEPLSAIRCD
jgi:predicted permease